MKRAKILEGLPFDWESGKRASDNVVGSDGNINWGAAFFADPGVTICPRCSTHFWAEGIRLECTECGAKFNTRK